MGSDYQLMADKVAYDSFDYKKYKITREIWKGKAHTVARKNGKFVARVRFGKFSKKRIKTKVFIKENTRTKKRYRTRFRVNVVIRDYTEYNKEKGGSPIISVYSDVLVLKGKVPLGRMRGFFPTSSKTKKYYKIVYSKYKFKRKNPKLDIKFDPNSFTHIIIDGFTNKSVSKVTRRKFFEGV